jgi:DnaK suppressor protein
MANIVSAEDTVAWRERLERRAAELRAEVRGVELSALQPQDATPPEVADQKDRAAEMETGRVQQAEQQRDLDELAQVEAALARLDAGSFGTCADCGESIGAARLAVMPSAARCAACQASSEAHRGAPARHG